MPDHPEEQHVALEQGGLLMLDGAVSGITGEDGEDLLGEDGVLLAEETGISYAMLEQQEAHQVSRVRYEGPEPYGFVMLEDGSGDVLLEAQPAMTQVPA